jgi:hypothetical protein
VIPLKFSDTPEPRFPQLPIPRLLVSGAFEPWIPSLIGQTAFAEAIVDTGAPYTIIPHYVHGAGLIKVYNDLGQQPYRLTSMSGAPLMQRMVEVGIRFLVRRAGWDYVPADFVVVRAYFLDVNVRPLRKVVIGLDAIRPHFPLFADSSRAFFFEPGESLQLP